VVHGIKILGNVLPVDAFSLKFCVNITLTFSSWK